MSHLNSHGLKCYVCWRNAIRKFHLSEDVFHKSPLLTLYCCFVCTKVIRDQFCELLLSNSQFSELRKCRFLNCWVQPFYGVLTLFRSNLLEVGMDVANFTFVGSSQLGKRQEYDIQSLLTIWCYMILKRFIEVKSCMMFCYVLLRSFALSL